jgi:hypothetical protein
VVVKTADRENTCSILQEDIAGCCSPDRFSSGGNSLGSKKVAGSSTGRASLGPNRLPAW